MSEEKPELENAIRIAIEAADAANSAAADIAEMKRQYKDASEKLVEARKSFGLFSVGIFMGVATALGVAGFMFFKTTGELKTTHATQIEALTVFSESVLELRQTLVQVEDVRDEILITLEQHNQSKTDFGSAASELVQNVEALNATVSEKIDMMIAENSALQPQMAATLTGQFEDELTMLKEDMQGNISDLQLALSKMIASGFSSLPKQGAVAPSPAKSAPNKPAVRKTPKPRKSAPKPAPNPFKFP